MKTKKRLNMIIGIDTETYQGSAILLSLSNSLFIESKTSYNYIKFLYENCKKSSFNIFYNISYDFSAIMKHYFINNKSVLKQYQKHKRINFKIFKLEQINKLNQEQEQELKKLNKEFDCFRLKFHIKEFEIVRIGNKSFSIKKTKNYEKPIYFFDISSFYAIKSTTISLEKASSKYLNKHKNAQELSISASKIGSEKGYYQKNRTEIIKYCKNDALLTQQLFINLLNTLHDINIPIPSKFFSKASITKQILNNNKLIQKETHAYKKLPNLIVEKSKNSFYGGLFKINCIGNYKDNVYNLDINSAYPTQIRKLKTLINCKIVNYKSDLFNQSTYKFFDIKIKSNPIFQTKIKGIIHYCYSKNYRYYTITDFDKKTLDLYKIKYEILDGYGILTDDYQPFKKIIDDIYTKKSDIKKKYGKSSYQYLLIKTIANALYGITAQKNPVETKYTNFIFATYITAYCRYKINKIAYQIENNGGKILTYETDGLVYQLKDKKTIDKLQKLNTKKLGDLEIEKLKEITIFGNGLEQVITENNKIIDKIRGFSKINLNDLRNCDATFLITKKTSVLKLDTAIIQKKLDFLNYFYQIEKEFNPYKTLSIKYKNNATIKTLLHTTLKDYFKYNFKLKFETI